MATPSRMMMPMSPIVSPKPLQDVLMMAIGSRPEHTPISRQPMNSERNGCSLNLMTSAKTTEMDTRKARMSERLPSMKGSCGRGWGVRGRTACRGEAGAGGVRGSSPSMCPPEVAGEAPPAEGLTKTRGKRFRLGLRITRGTRLRLTVQVLRGEWNTRPPTARRGSSTGKTSERSSQVSLWAPLPSRHRGRS